MNYFYKIFKGATDNFKIQNDSSTSLKMIAGPNLLHKFGNLQNIFVNFKENENADSIYDTSYIVNIGELKSENTESIIDNIEGVKRGYVYKNNIQTYGIQGKNINATKFDLNYLEGEFLNSETNPENKVLNIKGNIIDVSNFNSNSANIAERLSVKTNSNEQIGKLVTDALNTNNIVIEPTTKVNTNILTGIYSEDTSASIGDESCSSTLDGNSVTNITIGSIESKTIVPSLEISSVSTPNIADVTVVDPYPYYKKDENGNSIGEDNLNISVNVSENIVGGSILKGSTINNTDKIAKFSNGITAGNSIQIVNNDGRIISETGEDYSDKGVLTGTQLDIGVDQLNLKSWHSSGISLDADNTKSFKVNEYSGHIKYENEKYILYVPILTNSRSADVSPYIGFDITKGSITENNQTKNINICESKDTKGVSCSYDKDNILTITANEFIETEKTHDSPSAVVDDGIDYSKVTLVNNDVMTVKGFLKKYSNDDVIEDSGGENIIYEGSYQFKTNLPAGTFKLVTDTDKYTESIPTVFTTKPTLNEPSIVSQAAEIGRTKFVIKNNSAHAIEICSDMTMDNDSTSKNIESGNNATVYIGNYISGSARFYASKDNYNVSSEVYGTCKPKLSIPIIDSWSADDGDETGYLTIKNNNPVSCWGYICYENGTLYNVTELLDYSVTEKKGGLGPGNYKVKFVDYNDTDDDFAEYYSSDFTKTYTIKPTLKSPEVTVANSYGSATFSIKNKSKYTVDIYFNMQPNSNSFNGSTRVAKDLKSGESIKLDAYPVYSDGTYYFFAVKDGYNTSPGGKGTTDIKPLPPRIVTKDGNAGGSVYDNYDLTSVAYIKNDNPFDVYLSTPSTYTKYATIEANSVYTFVRNRIETLTLDFVKVSNEDNRSAYKDSLELKFTPHYKAKTPSIEVIHRDPDGEYVKLKVINNDDSAYTELYCDSGYGYGNKGSISECEIEVWNNCTFKTYAKPRSTGDLLFVIRTDSDEATMEVSNLAYLAPTIKLADKSTLALRKATVVNNSKAAWDIHLNSDGGVYEIPTGMAFGISSGEERSINIRKNGEIRLYVSSRYSKSAVTTKSVTLTGATPTLSIVSYNNGITSGSFKGNVSFKYGITNNDANDGLGFSYSYKVIASFTGLFKSGNISTEGYFNETIASGSINQAYTISPLEYSKTLYTSNFTDSRGGQLINRSTFSKLSVTITVVLTADNGNTISGSRSIDLL